MDGVRIDAHGQHHQAPAAQGRLDARVRAARLAGMLPSREEVVQTRLFNSDKITAAMILPGVLLQLDLPDLRLCYADREMTIASPLRVAALPEQLPLKRNAE